MNRHVLVTREEVVQERRHSTDVICVDGNTGAFDQRHGKGRVLPLKLSVEQGEKILILDVRLLYCTNDTEREWRFELHGLWDNPSPSSSGGGIQIMIPAKSQTWGPVPEKDQCIFQPTIVSQFPFGLSWVGQEHALLNVHSSHVGPPVNGAEPVAYGQLFMETDPFLQFTRNNWSKFKELSAYDVVLVSAPKDPPVYRISQHAVQRVTHSFKTLFEEVRYKTRNPWLELRVDPCSLIGNTAAPALEGGGGGFSGVVMMLQVAYMVVSPQVPKCRIVEQPINMHL